jgi:NADH:ubiquinone oxidoreductase subunit E
MSEQEKFSKLQAAIDKHQNTDGPLMPVLHEAQGIFGCLNYDVQKYIAEKMDVPMSEIYGVATFYSQFTLAPKGKYTIGVCLGTACYVKGSQKILDKVVQEIGVEAGNTTSDGNFTIEATRCIGACGLAPVIMINDDVYGRLDASDIPGILEKYKQAL